MVGKLSKDNMMSCSILATAMGENPYKSRIQLLDEMIAANLGVDIRKAQEKETPLNRRIMMSRGDVLEPVILKQAEKDLGLEDVEVNLPSALEHKEIPLQGSADGFCWAKDKFLREDPEKGIYVMTPTKEIVIDGIGAMECKLTSSFPEDAPPLWRGVVQLQGIMDIQKMKYGILAVCYQSVHWRYFIYPRNEEMVKRIHEVVIDMDRRIREEDYFPPETAEDAAIVNPIPRETHIDFEEDIIEQIDLFNAAKDGIKNWQEIKEAAQLAIMEAMGPNGTGSITVPEGLGTTTYEVKWGLRHIKPKPAEWKPAVQENYVRNKTIQIKEIKNEV